MGAHAGLHSYLTEGKMKALFLILALAAPAFAERVALPDDSAKSTVTVFANSEAEASRFLASSGVSVKGKHFNVYTPENGFTAARFGNPDRGVYVSTPQGETSCVWRCRKQKEEKTEPVALDEPDPEPTVEPEPEPAPNHTVLFVCLGLAAVAVGAASKFYEELKS